MKRLLSLFLIVTIIFSTFAGLIITSNAQIPSNGSCGTNITYTFNSKEGLLTIKGKGVMYNNSIFSNDDRLKKVIICSGVMNIGDSAFSYCGNLTSITIPNTVTIIGSNAFNCCVNLKSINIPNTVTKIGYSAFRNCRRLTSISIPPSVTEIDFSTFRDCYELKTIEIRGANCKIRDEDSIPFQATIIINGSKDVYNYAVKYNRKYVCYHVYEPNSSKCSVCGTKTNNYTPKEIVLSKSTYTYSGKTNKPAVTVKNNVGNVIDSSNYTVAYSNNINAGTAKVTVTFKGDMYEGSMSKTFKISPKKLTTCGLRTVHTYNGKAIVPTPYYYKTVKEYDYYDDEYYTYKKITPFKKNVDYTIYVSGGHKQVGTYTVVIKFKGNYSGSVKKTIQIRPKPVTKIIGSAYSTTSAKFVWNKVKNITGYRVDRLNSKTHKWQKYKFTKSNSLIVSRYSSKDAEVAIRVLTYKKVGGKIYYNDGSKTLSYGQLTKPNKPVITLKNVDFGEVNVIFNRTAPHQVQISNNRSFSNKGENYCRTQKDYSFIIICDNLLCNEKYYVRAREFQYNNSGNLIVGPWSDVKSITTY